ncbi:hypothetical protein HDU77_011867 [Chytriomyces hyalinus]|nr:hypothetical protein HDU77_011867 [Chytriomyces hyalinus]
MAPFHQDLPSIVRQNIILRLPVDWELHKLYKTMPVVKGIMSDIKFTIQHLWVHLSSVGVMEPKKLVAYKVALFTQAVLKDIESLMAKGISMYHRDYNNFRSDFNRDILQLPMAYKATFLMEVDIEDLPILYWASAVAPLLFVEDLLHMSSRKYRNLDTCLVHAAEYGHADSVSRLIEAGADPSWNDNQALRLGSMLGHEDVVCSLLNDLRTDPSVKSSEVLIPAMQHKHHTVVSLLLGRKSPYQWVADPCAKGNLAMVCALHPCSMSHECLRVIMADLRVNNTACDTGLVNCIDLRDVDGMKIIANDPKLDVISN